MSPAYSTFDELSVQSHNLDKLNFRTAGSVNVKANGWFLRKLGPVIWCDKRKRSSSAGWLTTCHSGTACYQRVTSMQRTTVSSWWQCRYLSLDKWKRGGRYRVRRLIVSSRDRYVECFFQSPWNLVSVLAAFNPQSRGFETTRDLAIRRLIGSSIGPCPPPPPPPPPPPLMYPFLTDNLLKVEVTRFTSIDWLQSQKG